MCSDRSTVREYACSCDLESFSFFRESVYHVFNKYDFKIAF